MRVIALIEDPQIIRRILEHLGRWAPQVSERSPPLGPEAWPAHASPPRTYHPYKDSSRGTRGKSAMQTAAGMGCSRIFVLFAERPGSADPAPERARATLVECDRGVRSTDPASL